MDMSKFMRKGKLNLADSSSSADEEQTDQEGEDQELMENTGPSVLNAPSIEQSYDTVSFQNSQQFLGHRLKSPQMNETEKSMTIIPEEDFEESLQPNAPLFRQRIQSLKIISEPIKLKLKKPPSDRYIESSQSEAKYVQSSEEDPLNTGRCSEEFILKMIDKQIYKSAFNEDSRFSNEMQMQEKQEAEILNTEMTERQETQISQRQDSLRQQISQRLETQNSLRKEIFQRQETQESEQYESQNSEPKKQNSEPQNQNSEVLKSQNSEPQQSQNSQVQKSQNSEPQKSLKTEKQDTQFSQQESDSVHDEIEQDPYEDEGEDEKYLQTESQTSLERKLSNSKIQIQSKKLFEDISINFSEEEMPPQKTSIQKMLEKYQQKYRQEKLIKSHGVPQINQPSILMVEERQRQIEFIKEKFPTVSNSNSEFDPDETIQSSTQYINRAKVMKVEESNENSQKTSELVSQSSYIDVTNFIKTYGLESTLGSLLGSTQKKNAVEQWIVVSHKLAENLHNEQDKYIRLNQQLKNTKAQIQSDRKIQETQYQHSINARDLEIKKLKKEISEMQKYHDSKLIEIKNRLKTTEKAIYTQIESEYCDLLKQKDDMLQEQTIQFEQVQACIKEMASRIDHERSNMQTAHELARENDRKELDTLKHQLEEQCKQDLAKEMKKCKEILAQEYEFKMKHLDEGYQLKESQLLDQYEQEREQMQIQKESEIKSAILTEKYKLQKDKAKIHAVATQEIYDDITATLKEKFSIESRAKLQDITSKLKKSFEEKVIQLEFQQKQSLAKEKQKLANCELKNEQLQKEVTEIQTKLKTFEKKAQESKQKEDLSYQLVNNLQPKKGSDGNCKRCEALIFANGLYIEKIKKLKKKNSLK